MAVPPSWGQLLTERAAADARGGERLGEREDMGVAGVGGE